MARIELTGPTQLWVNPVTGVDDPSRGLSPALPLKTRQYAWDFAMANIDLRGEQLYFNLFAADPVTGAPTGAGVTYTEAVSLAGHLVGQALYPIWRGVPYVSDSSPWSVVIHTVGHCWELDRNCEVGIDGMTLQSDGGSGVYSQWFSVAQMFRNIFYTCVGPHMECSKDGWVFQNGSDDPHKPAYIIWGSAPNHISGDLGRGFITGGDRSVCTVYGTPAFGAFASSIEPSGYVTSHTMQWSGPGWVYDDASKMFSLTPHGIGGQKFHGQAGGSIGHGFSGQGPSGTTDIQAYWPGTVAGTVDAPGVFE